MCLNRASVLPNAQTTKSQPKMLFVFGIMHAYHYVKLSENSNNFGSILGFSHIVKCTVFCRFVLSNDNIKNVCGVLCVCYFCCFVLDFGSLSVVFCFTRVDWAYLCVLLLLRYLLAFYVYVTHSNAEFSDSNANTQTNNNTKTMLKWTHFVHMYFVCSFCSQY